MDNLFAGLFEPAEPERWEDRLKRAVEWRKYPKLYALLRNAERELRSDEVVSLCIEALNQNLTEKAFREIVAHGPPLSQVLLEEWDDSEGGLVERAAAADRVDILDYLLSQGGNLNRNGHGKSPLEAAMEGFALHSVERLLQEPELDVTLTSRLLNCWSRGNSGLQMLDFCLQAAAPRLLGKEPSILEPVPFPDQLTPVHAVKAQNWRLVCRLCSGKSISLKEGKKVIREFPTWHRGMLQELDETDKVEYVGRADALSSLLTACPDLLRSERTCQLLIVYLLQCHGHDAHNVVWDALSPWLARIQGKTVLLDQILPLLGDILEDDLDFFDPFQEDRRIQRLLWLWQRYLPDGPSLAINRHTRIQCVEPETLEMMFQACIFRPGQTAKPESLSALAESLLRIGRPALIEAQFQPGGVLAGESQDALLEACQAEEYDKYTRGLVLTHIKKEASYEL